MLVFLPVLGLADNSLDIAYVDRLAVELLSPLIFPLFCLLRNLGGNRVFVHDRRKTRYLSEGRIEGGAVPKEGFPGSFHPILRLEGSFHELLELAPFWVLRAEVNMLKMPHPLQVEGVAVSVVADDFAAAISEEGVGIISFCESETYGFLGVSLG